MERDRQASRQRALQQISDRGMDPTSGIALQLLNDVDKAYDQSRAGAQNKLAYDQIQEQRSREQEAQQLLQYLTQLPDAIARGDLDFVQYLNSLMNQPTEQMIGYGATLADLPDKRLQMALQTLGMGPAPASLMSGVQGMINSQQAERMYRQQQTSEYWRRIGASFGV
jgi:hypothetical protein